MKSYSKRDPFYEYLNDLVRSTPPSGWSDPDDDDFLIHNVLAFRYFLAFLKSLSEKNPSVEQDIAILQFWNEVYDLREIEDVSCRLVRALSIIEAYILSKSQNTIPLPPEHFDALQTYYKKFSPIADKIEQGGTIRKEDQKKVADPRPLFTNLQTSLFDNIRKTYWSKFVSSTFYDQFNKQEKKELKMKDSVVVVAPPNSPLNQYSSSRGYVSDSMTSDDSKIHLSYEHHNPISKEESSSSIGSGDGSKSLSIGSAGSLENIPEILGTSEKAEKFEWNISTEYIRYDPKLFDSKLKIVRRNVQEVLENWETRTVFDFYVNHVLKKGRAPFFEYFLRLGLKSSNKKFQQNIVKYLIKLSPDLEILSSQREKLSKLYGSISKFNSTFDKQYQELLKELLQEIQPKLQIYHSKFVSSRPNALYLHLDSLYSQIMGTLFWTRNQTLIREPENKNNLELSKKICLHILKHFEQYGVEEFYNKQYNKLDKDGEIEIDSRFIIYSTLNLFIYQLFPQLKFHSLIYVCTKSPNIRYSISLLKTILKGMKTLERQEPVELPFMIKSTFVFGLPVTPFNFCSLVGEKKLLSSRNQNLCILTSNSFFQFDGFHAQVTKKRISYDSIKSVTFARDKKGNLIPPGGMIGFTIDTGKELVTFEVASRRERAVWLLAFYSVKSILVPVEIVENLFEQVFEKYSNEHTILSVMNKVIVASQN